MAQMLMRFLRDKAASHSAAVLQAPVAGPSESESWTEGEVPRRDRVGLVPGLVIALVLSVCCFSLLAQRAHGGAHQPAAMTQSSP